jgi:hypothetical protein
MCLPALRSFRLNRPNAAQASAEAAPSRSPATFSSRLRRQDPISTHSEQLNTNIAKRFESMATSARS